MPESNSMSGATELAQLFYASLLMSMEAGTEAQPIVDNTPAENGLEAWRRLDQRFAPASEHANLNIRSKIRKPPKNKIDRFSFLIEKWEEILR